MSTTQITHTRDREVLDQTPPLTAMIAAPQVLAAEAGAEALRRGGNAMDAAVTAAVVQGVVDPQMCGIGGGGVMTVHDAATGEDAVLEFLPRAGSLVRAEQWEPILVRDAAHAYGFVLQGAVNDIGYQSIGVPGTVLGLFEALARYGSISWADALAPAISIAAEGFPVSGFMRLDWEFDTGRDMTSHRKRLTTTPEGARVFTKDGALYEVGETLVLNDMAKTLERIAEEGPDAFYRGGLAEAMAADLAANGSTITAGDFAQYEALWAEPMRGDYRGYSVVAAGPPAGGTALLQLLNYVEGFDLGARDWPSGDEARIRATGMSWVFEEQERQMADPRFVPVPVNEMVSKGRADEGRRRFAQTPWTHRRAVADSPTTTQLSVVDSAGNAVAMTHTLGTWSGVVTPGLGFGYNNYLSAFDPRPGRVNSLAPGKTRVTMMAPTLIFDQGDLRAVIGGLGGNKILTGTAQTIVNLLDHDMSPVEAVSAPRIHCDGGTVHAEGRIPTPVVQHLEAHGIPVHRRPLNYDMFFALVQLVERRGDGTIRGASDPRGDGGVALTVRSVPSPQRGKESESDA